MSDPLSKNFPCLKVVCCRVRRDAGDRSAPAKTRTLAHRSWPLSKWLRGGNRQIRATVGLLTCPATRPNPRTRGIRRSAFTGTLFSSRSKATTSDHCKGDTDHHIECHHSDHCYCAVGVAARTAQLTSQVCGQTQDGKNCESNDRRHDASRWILLASGPWLIVVKK